MVLNELLYIQIQLSVWNRHSVFLESLALKYRLNTYSYVASGG